MYCSLRITGPPKNDKKLPPMNNTQNTVQKLLQYLSERDLKNLTTLFANNVDWYIPGDETNVLWLGKRKSRQEVLAFYRLLWQNTEPLSAIIDNIFIDGKKAIIAGEFSTRMLQTGKVVDSLFFIQLTVENNEIIKYRLLEDSYAVSVALAPVL